MAYKIFAACYLWAALVALFVLSNFMYWVFTGKEFIYKETAQDVYKRREGINDRDDC